MIEVLACIADDHNPALVVLACVICLFGCYSALNLLNRATAPHARRKSAWIAAAAIVAGLTVWATHFVAILAFHDNLNIIRYDIATTLASILVVLLLAAAAFSLLSRNVWLAGLVLGGAIGAMHYTGMAALRAPAHLIWNPRYIVWSIVIGAAASMAAFWVNGRGRDLSHRLAAAGLLTLAIAGLHFTGMTALTLQPDPTIATAGAIIDAGWMSAAIGTVMIFIVVLGGVGAGVDQLLAQRDARERDRLQTHVRALQAAQEQLSITAANLQDALAAANAANAAKTRFLAMMSHELRTPLNAIIGFSELMRRETAGAIGIPEYAEYVDIIHQSGEHLLGVVSDVLDMAKLDTGHLKLEKDIIDVPKLVARSLRMVEAQALEGGIALTSTIGSPVPMLRADERRLYQVMLNLLTNAIKFTPAGGTVAVNVLGAKSGLTIAIADTGVGIPPDKIATALEFFGQVENIMDRKHQGAGIGLPLSKQLIEIQGGTLTLDSTPGVGTTVTLAFPSNCLVGGSENGRSRAKKTAAIA
jgi:signal transduction histidine kinase